MSLRGKHALLSVLFLSACTVDVSRVPGPHAVDRNPSCASKTWYLDHDTDNFGDPGSAMQACEQPRGYVADDSDCDDTRADVNPREAEVCNGVDDNCDKRVDEDLLVQRYPDADHDEHGEKSAGLVLACPGQVGYSTSHDDCDDTHKDTYPDAAELCDGRDNDCNGKIDDNVRILSWYTDHDGDGFGDPQSSMVVQSCKRPGDKFAPSKDDCDDTNPVVHPKAPEVCDGLDNDCNAATGDGTQETWYDNPGVTCDASNDDDLCREDTYVCVSGQKTCETKNASLTESLCNNHDDDCDGQIDEGVTQTCSFGCGDVVQTCGANGHWNACSAPAMLRVYVDMDGDGHGDPTKPSSQCTLTTGYATMGDDCDDTRDDVKPGGSEICDNRDNNCDSRVDEAIGPQVCSNDCGSGHATCSAGKWVGCDAPGQVTIYRDSDGDGWGDAANSKQGCDGAVGWSKKSGDCDDGCATCNPGGSEASNICDSKDNDCNGKVDENGGMRTCTAPCGAGSQVCKATGGWDVCVGPSTSTFYRDADSDGFGNHQLPKALCDEGPGGDGFNYVADSTDCNDSCRDCHPGGAEICDDKDNDCDASTAIDVGFDLATDSHNCGKCGTQCGGSQQCYQSKCTAVTAIIDIDGGGNTACARRLSGATQCWGSNQFGSLGIGNANAPDCQPDPDNPGPGYCSTKPVSTGTFTGISLGTDYACATNPGTSSLSCWGDANNWRQGQQSSARGQNCVDTADTCQRAPTQVTSVSNIYSVETGDTHTCVVLASRQARCWGANNFGQLGNDIFGDDTASAQTVLNAAGSALTGVKQLALGQVHTCAALEAGGVVCWGGDTNGQLGEGATVVPDCTVTSKCRMRATPVVAPMNEAVDRLAAGFNFTCAIRHQNRRVYCWGDNSTGQLGQGDGAATSSATPLEAKLPTGLQFIDLSAGTSHVCALESGGDVYCWGQNDADQCGQGFANPLTSPKQVAGIADALEVALAAYSSCARIASGVVCWGFNMFGQLGNGNNDSIGLPQTVLLQ
jgi:alpha-tubulin suppressor-like RCC1 family protein